MSSSIVKTVQGNFNQGDARFGSTAGIQCSCNTLLSVFYSQFRRISIWKPHDLDDILTEGDINFKRLGFNECPYVDQFPKVIYMEQHKCTIEYSEITDGEYVNNEIVINFVNSDTLRNYSAALICIKEYTIVVIFENEFYIFDSHSRDAQGKISQNGNSILLRFKTMKHVKNYIYETYSGNKTCFFQVVYVNVTIENFEENKRVFLSNLAKRQKKIYNDKNSGKIVSSKEKYEKRKAEMRETSKRVHENIQGSEKHEQRKANMRETSKRVHENIQGSVKHEQCKANKRKNSKRVHENIQGSEKHKQRKANMRECKKKRKECKANVGETSINNKVEKFKNLIQEGPFYFCVCCNRGLYKRSMVHFNRESYLVDTNVVCSIVSTFNGKYYICLTCHKKLLKKNIPCQAVTNKLQLFNFPDELKDIGKLERILSSQRILFRKVAIMPKGQFPKLKGAICNIPIETANICNVLPRGINNSGVVFVQLKRKLTHKFPVFSEPVRQEKLIMLLKFLHENNHLYANTQIDLSKINDFDQINNETLDDSVNDQIDFNVDQSTIIKELKIKFVNEDTVELIQSFENKEDDFLKEDPLNSYQTPANETLLISEIPNVVIDDENSILAPGQDKTPFSLTNDEFCEELAHPHLFPTGRYGYKVQRDEKLTATKYFNQRLLNYSQRFSSDTDYIFFAHQVLQQLRLKSQINIAMKKVTSTGNMTAGMLGQNFQQTIQNCIAADRAYKFMTTVKGTPAYWQHMLSDVLAMVKQLGVPSYFMTLSCADLRWNELVIIISKLKGQNISNEEVDNLSYFDRCEQLNSNPVLVARHFQYRVENFFKEIVINGQLGKIIYYAIRVEFQVRGSPHVHCLLWEENTPTLNSETKQEYVQYVDNVMSANMPDITENVLLHNLVEKFQIHSHSKSCRKYNKNECRFGFGHFFCTKTIIAEPLQDDLSDIERKVILKQRAQVLDKVRKYIDINLNPRKQNILKPNEPDYIDVGSVVEILQFLEVSLIDYEYYLSVSPDKDFYVHLKRNPLSCFVNNYFSDGLLSWEANLDIQPVFNYYKAVTYMCAYFSKCEDKCSVAMTQALDQAKEFDKSKFETMTNIAKAYNSNRECSVQEAVYLTMPELWLRKCFPAISFVNTNLPDQRFRMVKGPHEIEELPEESEDVFKRNMLDRYLDRPNRTFKQGRYAVLDNMCYAAFCANYVLDSKLSIDDNDCQPVILDDDAIETNHIDTQLPRSVPLMSSNEKLRSRKVRKVLRYYVPNQHKFPEKYAHHMLMLFYPFRCEKVDLMHDDSHVLKLNQQEVNEIVNRNKQIFEPNAELVELVMRNYRNDLEHNQDPNAQQENDEVIGIINETIEDEIDDLDADVNRPEQFDTFTSRPHSLLSNDELNSCIRSLNKKQREIFDVVLKWGKLFIQNLNMDNSIDVEPLLLFLTGGGGMGKSHLVKCIYHSLSKILIYKKGELEKQRVLKLAPTGIASINIEATTIHSGLKIPIKFFKPLKDKQRTALRNKLQYVQLFIIDEISMVSSTLLLNFHFRLCEIFGLKDQTIPFAGKSVIVCGDLYQLPPVSASPVFSLVGPAVSAHKLWYLFKLCELTESMRQRGDETFIDLLNNVRVGELEPEEEKLLKTRFISINDPNYPWHALHLFAENAAANSHNILMLDSIPSDKITIGSIDNLPSNFSAREIEQVLALKPSKTGQLVKELKLKVGVRVMLIANIDIDDKLVNGQLGTILHFRLRNNRVEVVYLKFDDEKAGLKLQSKDRYATSTHSVPIERTESVFSLNGKNVMENSPLTIRRMQFPLMLSYACTVHKVQGLTLDQVVISFDLLRQRGFNPGQMYVAMSRVKSINGLYLTGIYNSSVFTCNDKVTSEYTRLRHKDNRLAPLVDFQRLEESLIISLLNVRSLKLHSVDLKSDFFFENSDILCLTETQIGFSQNTSEVDNIEQELDTFNISFNNDQHKYNSLAVCHHDDINVLEYDHSSCYSIMKFKKPSFNEKQLCLLLLYRNSRTPLNVFLCQLSNFIRSFKIDIILGDFNINAFEEETCAGLCDVTNEYEMVIDFSTHIDGGLLDHVFIHKELMEQFDVKVLRKMVNISDHDAVKVKLTTTETDNDSC